MARESLPAFYSFFAMAMRCLVVALILASCCGCVYGTGVPQWIRRRAAQLSNGRNDRLTPANAMELLSIASDEAVRVMSTTIRKFDTVEVCSGSGGTTKAIRRLGMVGQTFDRIDDPTEDLCHLSGLLFVTYLVLQIKRGACMIISPQCSTWLNMCRYHTKRSLQDPFGDEGRQDVFEANFTSMVVSPMRLHSAV